jgi:hypothetical protein
MREGEGGRSRRGRREGRAHRRWGRREGGAVGRPWGGGGGAWGRLGEGEDLRRLIP